MSIRLCILFVEVIYFGLNHCSWMMYICINKLKCVPNGPVNNIPALVQAMAWHQPGNKPLSEPMMVSLLMHTDCSLNVFKGLLDKFLASVPDEPLIRGYTAYRRADTVCLTWYDLPQPSHCLDWKSQITYLMLEAATHGHLRNSPKNYPQVSTRKYHSALMS